MINRGNPMQAIHDRQLLENYIRRFGLEAIFDPDVIERMELRRFEKGELICKSSAELRHLYFLVTGKVKISSFLENGKSLLLRFNKPLSVLGDVEFLNQFQVRCNVESVTETRLIAVTFEVLNRFAYDNPRFLRFIIQNLSDKLYRSSLSASINLLYPLEKRLAGYLLSISSDENNLPCGNDIMNLKMTELASFFGTSYRHLNRVINSLITKNVLKKEKGKIIISDFQKLKELSGGNLYE